MAAEAALVNVEEECIMFKKIRVLLAAGLMLMGTQSVAFADEYYETDDGYGVYVDDDGYVGVADEDGNVAVVDPNGDVWVEE